MTWSAVVQGELDKCTDCGLCLSACPTYAPGREEGESPRGRIHLLGLALKGGADDDIAACHLDSCLECGACHTPCPTGVRVAFAQQAHRMTSGGLDRLGFEQKVAQLHAAIASDPGAVLTVQSVRDLLSKPDRQNVMSAGTRPGEVLALFGPSLRRVAPAMVRDLEHRLSRSTPTPIEDQVLASSLERASGLLRDVGLFADHERAIANVLASMAARAYATLTVAVFDQPLLRLADEPRFQGLRVLPAYAVWPTAIPEALDGLVWDSAVEGGPAVPDPLSRCLRLPSTYSAAGAPVLLSSAVLRTIQNLNEAKRTWLADRRLLTWDARTVARFLGSRHLSEFLAPAPGTGQVNHDL